MSKGWNQYRAHVKQQSISAYKRAQNPIDWEPGEQQALIAKTLAEGRVTKCPPGAYTESTFNPYVGGISPTTIDSMLPQRRAIGRASSGA